MSELQTALLVIGALVVIGVLVYNRLQERGAKRAAEQAFRSGHDDVLMAQSLAASPHDAAAESPRHVMRGVNAPEDTQPDPAIDYIVDLASEKPLLRSSIQEQWNAIERRHAHRALLAGAPDGRSWRAGLQLVSRDGAVGEADLIEFRSAVETLAATVGATVAAPEMRAAVEAARALDEFCAESDIQVVVHVQGGPFPGARLRAAVEASGLALETDGKFALRDGEGRLLYTLGVQDGTPFSASTVRAATPRAVSLSLDVTRAPDTRRSFESMARLAHQLAAVLGGSLVDDNGKPLDEHAIAAIAAQLDAVSTRLAAQGVAPGSPAALRLFS